MKIKRILLTCSFFIIATIASQYANAALLNGSTLSFTPIASGSASSSLPADGLGSWYSMEISPGTFFITPITSLNGVVLGTTQLASSSPTPVGNIDVPWLFSANPGAHQTVSNSNVLTVTGDTATVDFSGWNITWNAIPNIDMGAGAWNGNADCVAELTCSSGSSCGDGASYILDYSATAPAGDPSSYGGVRYAIHLEGTISAVPVPAAILVVWFRAIRFDWNISSQVSEANIIKLTTVAKDLRIIDESVTRKLSLELIRRGLPEIPQ